MSVIELERPAAPAPEHRDWLTWTDIGVRAVLLSVLLAAGVVVFPAHHPRASTPDAFLRDVAAHRVTVGDYTASSRELRWGDGWQHWYHTSLGSGPLPVEPKAWPGYHDDTFPGDPQAEADMEWANRALVANRSVVMVGQRSTGDHGFADLPSGGLSRFAGIAALLGFFWMLGRDKRRYASRWGWFWIIALGGVWGVAGFLLLEPMPLWWRSRQDRPMPEAPPVRGGRGFLLGLVVKAGPLLVLWGLARMLFQLMPR